MPHDDIVSDDLLPGSLLNATQGNGAREFSSVGLPAIDVTNLAAWIEEIRDYQRLLHADELEAGTLTDEDLGKIVGDFISGNPNVARTAEVFKGGTPFVEAFEQFEAETDPEGAGFDVLNPDFELGPDFSENVPEFAEGTDGNPLDLRSGGRYARNLSAAFPGASTEEGEFPWLYGDPGIDWRSRVDESVESPLPGLSETDWRDTQARGLAREFGRGQLADAEQRTAQRGAHRQLAMPITGPRGLHATTTYQPRQLETGGRTFIPPSPSPTDENVGVFNDPAPYQPPSPLSFADEAMDNHPVLPLRPF